MRTRWESAAGARLAVVGDRGGKLEETLQTRCCWRWRGGSRRRRGRVEFCVAPIWDVRDQDGFDVRQRPNDRTGAGVPNDSATVKLFDGVRRSSSLASADTGEIGDPGSLSMGLE